MTKQLSPFGFMIAFLFVGYGMGKMEHTPGGWGPFLFGVAIILVDSYFKLKRAKPKRAQKSTPQ